MSLLTQNHQTKCGFTTILGPTNAGKSTLLNRLVGQKLAIVTHKVQTTRTRLRGVALYGKDTQIIYIDTPGIFKAKHRLERAMIQEAWDGASDADQIIFLIDSRAGITEAINRAIGELEGKNNNCILALNKVDLVEKGKLLALTQDMNALFPFSKTMMISAQTGQGVDDLEKEIASRMPKGPFLYPEDQMSDTPMRIIAAEVTREKIFLRLHQEIPYSATVETEKWEQSKKGIRIEQTIYVTRDSHKKIVLGKNGATIKKIGETARLELSEMLGEKVHLFLFVKVRENWQNDNERYKMMGIQNPAK